MGTPVLHDLQFLRNDFPEIRLPNVWEISTSKRDDIIWNIVLSYLHPFPFASIELTERIQRLTGTAEEVSAYIRQSFDTCNPFLHHDSYCSNEHLINLVNKFKKRVEDNLCNDETSFPTPDKKSMYLEVSSKLLYCDIFLISLKDKTVKVFPTENSLNTKHISILDKSDSSGKDGDQFCFCIPEVIGLAKKFVALFRILRNVRHIHYSERQKIIRLPDINDNFLIALLKNNCIRAIRFIYESPSTLTKLSDAGYETDPKAKDISGKSSFFYALKIRDRPKIVSLLYNYAANGCLQTDASVRSPDSMIVENLLSLKDELKLLETDLNSKEFSESSRCLFKDLCRFNEFQIEICDHINNIRIKFNGKTDEKSEVLQRKETVITILKTYETYYNYNNGDPETSINAHNKFCYEKFLEHQYYFKNLDFSSAMLFFDNLFLLKERLNLKENAYLEVESNFFLYIFFVKYFEKYTKYEPYGYRMSLLLSFQERVSVKNVLQKFREILEKQNMTENGIIAKMSELTISTKEFHEEKERSVEEIREEDNNLSLSNYPAIYGQFLIVKLKSYLKSATEITIKDSKSILVIERCLQVIGECCEKPKFRSVQSILILALSEAFSKRLNDIRHSLSHINSHELFYRKILSQNVDFFKEIQKELIKFTQLLQPIYSFHEYDLEQFLLSHFVQSLEKLKEGEIQTSETIKNLEIDVEKILSSLKKKINVMKFNGEVLQKNNVGYFKHIIHNIMFAIKEEMSVIPVKTEKLDSHFWCFKKILTYMATNTKHTDRYLEKMERIMILRKSDTNVYHDYHVKNIFKMCKIIVSKLFRKFPDDSSEDFNFKNIENYCLKLEGKKILTENEIEFVLNSVPEKFKNQDATIQDIKTLLDKRIEFTKELNDKLSTLGLSRNNIDKIKKELKKGETKITLNIIENAPDNFLKLKNTMVSEKLLKKEEYMELCQKLELPDEAKNVFLQLKPVYNSCKMEFLLNQIEMLKNILIDDHKDIKQLWKRETGSSRIMHVREKVVQLYLNDVQFQASVEGLLYRCMVISRNKKLKRLWKKTRNLFCGINLRNVLAHGHALLESVNPLLDPYDLPSEIVGKMLQLILDKNVIYCMKKIVDESGTDYEGFMGMTKDAQNDQMKQILECDRWESYAVLIPKSKKKNKKQGADGVPCSLKGQLPEP